MNRKQLMVVAVAAAFAAPAAFAQSSVTIGGTINILWDNARATGATNNGGAVNNDLKSADRVRDGAGSNIRFTVIEDLGGGNSAFVQVESAVIQNSDQRTDALGKFGGSFASGNAAAVWGNRNTGIGLRSKTMGRILIGVWDVHYHETYAIDPGWIPMNSAQSILGLMNTFGAATNNQGAIAIGGRYSNVIRWDSPTWSGFTIGVAYARPTDGAPPNAPGSITDSKKNRVWNFAPKYENGGLTVQYSYLQDKDITSSGIALFPATAAAAAAAVPGNSLWKITSNRIGVRYVFANAFGIGAMWDSSKASVGSEGAAVAGVFPALGSSSIKRTVWAFPLTYDMGNHHIVGTYARARDWRGTIGGLGIGGLQTAVVVQGATYNLGSDTGAKMYSFGYSYNLSQRTNVHLSYARIKNDPLARYDMFANSSGIGPNQYGADPRIMGVGLRHTW